MEIVIQPGTLLFVPAYWWYSIKFNNNSSISCFYYRTYMNNLTILPHIIMYGLQMQNVKRNVAKKVSLEELKNTFTEKNDNVENIVKDTPTELVVNLQTDSNSTILQTT
jgi:hypothetical protein